MGIHRRSLYDTFGDKHTLFLKTIDCYEELIKDKIQAGILHTETAKQAIQFILDRKSTRLNSSHSDRSRMPSSA